MSLSSIGFVGVPLLSTLAIPFAGTCVIVIAVALAPSPPKLSLAVTLIVVAVASSKITTPSVLAVGRLFTKLIVMWTIAVSKSPSMSSIR